MTTFANQTKNSTTYSGVSKSSSTFVNDSKSTTYFEFLIDDTYSLLVESPYTFLLGDSSTIVSWSNATKN